MDFSFRVQAVHETDSFTFTAFQWLLFGWERLRIIASKINPCSRILPQGKKTARPRGAPSLTFTVTALAALRAILIIPPAVSLVLRLATQRATSPSQGRIQTSKLCMCARQPFMCTNQPIPRNLYKCTRRQFPSCSKPIKHSRTFRRRRQSPPILF